MTSALKPIRARDHRTHRRWLLASLSFHSVVLILVIFLADSQSNGRGTFGLAQEGTLTVTWIPGSGGGGNGQIDTIVSDGESGESLEPIKTDPMPAVAKSSSLLAVVETDPQSVFNPESIEPLTIPTSETSVTPTDSDSVAERLNHAERIPNKTDFAAVGAQQTSAVANSSSASNASPDENHSGLNSGGNESVKKVRGLGSGDGRSKGDGGSQVQFFGLFARAKRVVYVIDASESMRKHKAMETARDELLQSLKGLEPSAQFQVVFFDLNTHIMNQGNERSKLVRATASNLRLAELFIKGIQPDAGTDRFLAVTHAMSFEPDVIFLLTDADEPEMSAKDLSDIQRANKRKTAIHVVEFGVGADLSRDSFLKRLARQNGGKHHYRDLTKVER